MIDEPRIHESGPRTLPAPSDRFGPVTLKRRHKHGVLQPGFCRTRPIGSSQQRLYDCLQRQNLAKREAKRSVLIAAPNRTRARGETDHDGPVVARVSNRILTPTAYSGVC